MKKILVGLVIAAVSGAAGYFAHGAKNPTDTASSDASVVAKAQEQEKKVYNWQMVTSWPKNFPGLGTGPERFAENVTAMSNGRLNIKVYGAGELVPALEVFNAVSSGKVQMGHSGAYFWKGKVPAAQFFTAVPFGMNAQEMNAWIHMGGGLELWEELYEPFNVIPLAGGNTGVQTGGWFNKEINSLDDIQGLKMRIPGLGGEVFNRVGGTAVTISGGELFESLKKGVIDATEWVGPYNDLAFGFHQAAKYMYYPGWHEPGSVMELSVNKQAFEGLPKDLQAIVRVAARDLNARMLDEYTAFNNKALNELIEEHGVEVRRFPDDVLAKLKVTSEEVLQEMADKDPKVAKVYKSFKTFKEQSQNYHKLSEEAFYDARD